MFDQSPEDERILFSVLGAGGGEDSASAKDCEHCAVAEVAHGLGDGTFEIPESSRI